MFDKQNSPYIENIILVLFFMVTLQSCGGSESGSSTPSQSYVQTTFDGQKYEYKSGTYYESTEGLTYEQQDFVFSNEILINPYRGYTKFDFSSRENGVYPNNKPALEVSFVVDEDLTKTKTVVSDAKFRNVSFAAYLPDGRVYRYRKDGTSGVARVDNIDVIIDSISANVKFSSTYNQEIAGSVLLDFTDTSGDSHYIIQSIDIKNDTSVPVVEVTKDGSLAGCWLNARIDAWCFDDGIGQYVQFSVNGNPGTMYITFQAKIDSSAGIIEARNTEIRLDGSCCDSVKALDADWKSTPYRVSGDILYLGDREYIYTTSDLTYSMGIWRTGI